MACKAACREGSPLPERVEALPAGLDTTGTSALPIPGGPWWGGLAMLSLPVPLQQHWGQLRLGSPREVLQVRGLLRGSFSQWGRYHRAILGMDTGTE